MPPRTVFFKKEFFALTVVVLILGLAVFSYAIYDRPIDQTIITPPAGEVVIRGTLVCLPHRDTRGPQTLECAFGLKDDAERYYGLRDSDPLYSNISRVPMNSAVDVSGIFTPKEDATYQSIGTIEVQSLTVVASSIGTTSKSGISGIVLVGPTCPVESMPPDPQCADRPLATDLILTSLDGVRTIATFSSRTNGTFTVGVAPGVYSIRDASDNRLPSCGATEVTVRADQYTDITVSCDSGIR